MKNKFRHFLLSFAALAVAVPAFAVFNEKDLPQTLSVLRFELSQENHKMENSRATLNRRDFNQHRELVEVMKKCNELALVLYSQNQDFTFDMTYALNEVTDQYEAFSKRRMPYDEIVTRLGLEIERYQRLIESLRRLPPVLDEISEVPDSISVPSDSLMKTFRLGFAVIRTDSASVARRDSLRRVFTETARRRDSLKAAGNNGMIDSLSRKNPFMLDEQGLVDRDSCLFYARNLLRMYTETRDRIVADNDHYESASSRLKETYEYAQNRYKVIQKHIFIDGQDNYFKVLSSFPSYVKRAFQEAAGKYGTTFDIDGDRLTSKSEWRGPVVVGFIFLVFAYILFATVLSNVIVSILMKRVKLLQSDKFRRNRLCFTLLCGFVIFALTLMVANRYVHHNFFILASELLLVFAWLVAAILLSLLIRLHGEQIKCGLKLYTPVVLLGILVITFRIIFIPNKLVNLVFPPILLIFFIWQIRVCKRYKAKVSRNDMVFSSITMVVMGITTILSFTGYVLLGVQAFMWWLFQLAAIETITAIYHLLSSYENAFLSKKLKAYKQNHAALVAQGKNGSFIQVTWLFDLIKNAAVPVIAILSVPLCIWLAADVFDLTDICRDAFVKPFFNLTDSAGNDILHLSFKKIMIVVALFFVFRFINYAVKSFYHKYRIDKAMRESGQDYVHANQINFTLANNLFGILIWGIYIIMSIILLKIPMGAISIVAAGLATGIGLALKDVLNNFIYGIQLMSGRLRVGDYVECDGIRGKVDSISYQSTQIETVDGALMAFTNTSLFNKNFKNLTRNNSYELVKVGVGVHYGADVNFVRDILVKAMGTLQDKDKYGRWIIEPDFGVKLVFDNFGDNSIDLVLKQYILVEEGPGFIARAKEIIYNTLNENGVEIPFPQRDIHIIK